MLYVYMCIRACVLLLILILFFTATYCYVLQLEMHVRLICAIKFYLLTYLLTYYTRCTFSVVCLSVSGTQENPAKTDETTENPCGHVGRKNRGSMSDRRAALQKRLNRS